MELNLTRPLSFFDLETTGVDVGTDRIIEIAILKAMPDGSTKKLHHYINPGMPIPEQSSLIHGIYDKDVQDHPKFSELAHEIHQFIVGTDLSGYNAIKFDVPLLAEEFLRAGIDFDINKHRIIDVQNIFHKMEPRTLKAAYKFYCNNELVDAHSAEADTLATYEILKAQLDKYDGVSYEDRDGNISEPVVNDVDALSKFSFYNKNVDLVGHIVFNDKGQEVFNFGKNKGKPVELVFEKEPQYYNWMMNANFPQYTKKVITSIKLRQFNKGDIR
jgi:DNA polymerase-3 subunit epsilon